MNVFRKTKLAAAMGTATLAAALCSPANAAVVLGGDNGWEVSYGGFVNLFYTQSDFEFIGGGSEDSSHLNEGLLPAFHTLTAKSPEIGGLKGTAQITFAPDSSGPKGKRLNKGGGEIDTREVFFNVEGDFGTISAGRTLALYQRQAILKDYTLFGVGALAGPDGGGTALGRIGFGYVYPDFRTRFTYKTPVVNGFQLEVGVFDPQETTGSVLNVLEEVGAPVDAPGRPNIMETDTPQFQAEGTFTTGFEGGNFNAWFGLVWQEAEVTGAGGDGATVQAFGGTGDIETFGWNVGGEINFQGFNLMASYYDGDAIGTLTLLDGLVFASWACSDTQCDEAENDGFIVQGAYTFAGKTKVGVSYGDTNRDDLSVPGTAAAAFIPETSNELWTVGVYHDVNSWLKVMAEYGHYESDELGFDEVDTFSVGGFLLW